MRKTMDTKHETTRSLAPEDVREGDYVTVSRQVIELLPMFCDEAWRKPEVQRVRVMPGWAGYPLRVVRVCLPFVLAKNPQGQGVTLDVRRHELSKLTDDYGKKAFKCFDPAKAAKA